MAAIRAFEAVQLQAPSTCHWDPVARIEATVISSKAIDRKPDASISEEDEVLEHASKSLKTLAHSRYQNWRLQNGNIDRAVLDP
jgi:hypothetical protein